VIYILRYKRKGQNFEFISCNYNSDFIYCNFDFISHDSEIKSRVYFLFCGENKLPYFCLAFMGLLHVCPSVHLEISLSNSNSNSNELYWHDLYSIAKALAVT